MKVIFIPGNGGGSPKDVWFPYLKVELEKLGIPVISSEFPDNNLARESYWIPFLHSLQPDDQTILIGYSSGAIAAMRFAENNKILGSVLVGAYHTDMEIPSETTSGYFDRPWNWGLIKDNQKWILQFSSTDDPCIPISEARFVHEKLDTEYYECVNKGHFWINAFPEVLQALKKRLLL